MIDNFAPGISTIRHKDGRFGRVTSIMTDSGLDNYQISWLCETDGNIHTNNISDLEVIRKFN